MSEKPPLWILQFGIILFLVAAILNNYFDVLFPSLTN